MTMRIAHLIEEQENHANIFQNKDMDVEDGRKLEDPQKTKVPIPSKYEALPLIPRNNLDSAKLLC
jgi:hypothetical protein